MKALGVTRLRDGYVAWLGIPTWTDEHLAVAVELVHPREPGLNLHTCGVYPDRHEAFLHARSAELVEGVVGRFKDDGRIAVWQLYNE